jgi:hypothetical protein
MLRRWLWIGIALLFVAGLGTLVAQAVLAIPPATIEEAVRMTLQQNGANVAKVTIMNAQCVPSRDTCLSYIADVVIGTERESGRLACRTPWQACTLTMAEFGLRAAIVPDVGERNPLVTELQTALQEGANWIRRLVKHT